MAQRKETKNRVKVRDLKPKKDAKGGRNSRAGDRPGQGDGLQGHQLNQANRQI